MHRNNQFYDFLLKVCELIFRHLLPTGRGTRSGASSATSCRDERQMAAVFETVRAEFLSNLETARTACKREDIHWRWIAADRWCARPLTQDADGCQPHVRRRGSSSSNAKFTPEATKRHYEADKLRSSHLYQIHAYSSNLPNSELNDTCEVILLYPAVDTPMNASYIYGRHK